MKVQFEEQIQSLEERTAQLLMATGITEQRVLEQTPEFEQLQKAYAQATKLYEAAKEAMIDTKRKKQDKIEKTTAVQQAIQEKIRARDVSMLAVKECQRDTQQRMQTSHDATIRLEKDIYEKGCRLEMLDTENERFRQVIPVVGQVTFDGLSRADDRRFTTSSRAIQSILSAIQRRHAASRREQSRPTRFVRGIDR